MSKGGGGSTSTVQKADPWSGVQPGLTQLYSSALNNFNTAGPQYYPGSTVAPQSPITQQGQTDLYGLATTQGPVLQAGQQQAYNTANGAYLNSNPAMQDLYNLAGRDYLGASPVAADLYDSTGQNFFGSTPGMQGLQSTANGSMLNANPYLDAMFNKASSAVGRQFSNNVMPGVASMFAGGGRYGSNQMAEGLGQAQQQYGNTLNDLATQIYGGNYTQERGLQQNAQSQLGQFGLSATGQRQSALSNLLQMGLAGQAQQQSALSTLGTQYGQERALQMGATGMSPGLDQASYYAPQQLLGLGAQQDAYQQALNSADQSRYNFGQQAPNQQLQQLSSLLNGYPMGSTSNSSVNPQQSLLTSLLGGANLAGSLYNNFGSLFGGGTSASTIANAGGTMGMADWLPAGSEALFGAGAGTSAADLGMAALFL